MNTCIDMLLFVVKKERRATPSQIEILYLFKVRLNFNNAMAMHPSRDQ